MKPLFCFFTFTLLAVMAHAQVLDAVYKPQAKLYEAQLAGDCSMGLRNDSGRWVVQPVYSSIREFYTVYGQASWWIFSPDGMSYGLLDSKGQERLPARYLDIAPLQHYGSYTFGSRFVMAKLKDDYGIVRNDNTIIVPMVYSSMAPAFEGPPFFYMRKPDSTAVYDTTGHLLVPPRKGYVSFFTNGHALTWQREKSFYDNHFYIVRYELGFVDSTGRELYPGIFDATEFESDHGALVQKKGRWGFVNWSGDTLLPFDYSRVELMKGTNYCIVVKDGRQGLIDQRGNWILPAEYDSIQPPSKTGVIPVQRNGHWQIFNPRGYFNAGIQPEHIESYRLYDYSNTVYEFTFAQSNGLTGLLSDSGYWLIPPKYTAAGRIGGGGGYPEKTFWGVENDTLNVFYFTLRKHPADRPAPPLQHLQQLNNTSDSAWVLEGNRVRIFEMQFRFVQTKGKAALSSKPASDVKAPAYDVTLDRIRFEGLYTKEKNIFRNENTSVVTDAHGKLLLPPLPYLLKPLDNGAYMAQGPKGNGIIDAAGKIIVPPVYKNAAPLWLSRVAGDTPPDSLHNDHHYYVETAAGHFGAYDSLGRLVLDTQYFEIHHFLERDGYWMVKYFNKAYYTWQFLDAKEHLLGEAIHYPEISGRYASCYGAKNYSLVSLRGDHPPVESHLHNITPAGYGRFTFTHKYKKGLVDGRGHELLPARFGTLGPLVNGYSIVRRKDAYGLVDSNGVFIIPLERRPLYACGRSLRSYFNGSPFSDPRSSYLPHMGDTLPPAAGRIQNVFVNGRYELLADSVSVPQQQLINNYILETVMKKSATFTGSYQFNSAIIKPGIASSYYYRNLAMEDLRIEAITGHTFTLRTLTSRYSYSKVIDSNSETFDNYVIENGRIREVDFKSLFLPNSGYAQAVNGMVLNFLREHAPENFIHACGKPGAPSFNNFIITKDGLQLCIENERKFDSSSSPESFLPARRLNLTIPYTTLKPYIDPQGPLGEFIR